MGQEGLRNVNDVIERLGSSPPVARLPAPKYISPDQQIFSTRSKLGLAVESMKRHMSPEGWELFAGLELAGYRLAGYNLPTLSGTTDVRQLVKKFNPSVVVVQDEREWRKSSPRDFRDERETYHNLFAIQERKDIFRLTLIKDAHQRPEFHRLSAERMGCHAWIIYYHPRIVTHLAPYVRPEHLIRTYHSVEPNHVPIFSTERRSGCILSGALGPVYPLRSRIQVGRESLPDLVWLKHPGYHARGCHTPDYLKKLSQFKVSICTSSIFGYSLRKIIESTACGCVVITDLPVDDVLPGIDANLVRVSPNISLTMLSGILRGLYERYDGERQEHFATIARSLYDWRRTGLTLAADIEKMRMTYKVE